MKDVSVILPVYNAEDTIGRAIESVLNQDFKDIELIIVNDHSNDKTEQICSKYQEKYNNIIILNNIEGKKGVSSARNLGISKSSGKYLMFIDSDDYYEQNMISTMVKYISESDLVVCGFKKSDNSKDVKELYIKETEAKNIDEIKVMIELLQQNDLFSESCNKIFKNEIIKKNNLKFPEDISLGEDYLFILDYIQQVKNIQVIENTFYFYDRSDGGLPLKYRDDNLQTRLNNAKYHRDFYKKNNLNTNYIDKKYIRIIISGYAEIIRNNKKNDSKKIIKQYIEDKKFNQMLHEIEEDCVSFKIKVVIKMLTIKSITFAYGIGKIYNIIKKIYKR